MRWTSVAAFLVLGPAAARSAPAPATPTVQVRGIRIVGPGYEEEPRLRPFSWTEGTSVALLVRVPGGGLIAFDEEASALERFADEKGTDLLKAKGSRTFDRTGYGNCTLSDDRSAYVVAVQSPGRPAKGARLLRLAGTLVLKAATGKKAYTQRDVALRKGTAVKAGPIPLTISEVGAPEWAMEEEKFAVSFEAKRDLTPIAGIRFLDAKGAEIPSARRATASMGLFGAKTVTWTYHLKRKIDRAAIEVTCWTGLREIRVPYATETGVGF